MKRATKLYLTGSVQGLFFEQFVKETAEKINVRGFLRKLDDGRMEIFVEGDGEKVDQMVEACKKGHQHTQIRNAEEKPEKFQGFKEFKVLKI